MNILSICKNEEFSKFQIRNIQMSDRSTLVDNNTPGGLSFADGDFKTSEEYTGETTGSKKIWKLY